VGADLQPQAGSGGGGRGAQGIGLVVGQEAAGVVGDLAQTGVHPTHLLGLGTARSVCAGRARSRKRPWAGVSACMTSVASTTAAAVQVVFSSGQIAVSGQT